MMKGEYDMTDLFLELYTKSQFFALAMDYDVSIVGGKFSFYNSPSFQSFSFMVDPLTFHLDPSVF